MSVRIVIDTNVLLSAFLWGGMPRRLIERVHEQTAELVTSIALLEEFERVITRPKFAAILARTSSFPECILAQLRILCDVVAAPSLPQPACRDPKDDIVLACALYASAHLIVTGDTDLLSLRSFKQIPIMTPAQALAWIEERSGS